jgi:hypothetical protein
LFREENITLPFPILPLLLSSSSILLLLSSLRHILLQHTKTSSIHG